jgi:hypothetical protein
VEAGGHLTLLSGWRSARFIAPQPSGVTRKVVSQTRRPQR